MKLISRITLIITAAAGIIFIILGISLMGMGGYMNSVVNNPTTSTTTSEITVLEDDTTTTEISGTADIYIPEEEEAPDYTSGGATSMLVLGAILLIYGIGAAVVSILSLNKLEAAKTKKDIKLFAILSMIFAFVVPGVFLIRLKDSDIKDKEEIESRRR